MKAFAFHAIALLLLAPTVLAAQINTVDLTLEHVFDGGPGVERSCLEPGHSSAFGARLSHGLSRLWSIEVAARAYVFETPSTCVDGFPPPDGTYVQDDLIPLLAASFLTSDLRLRANLGPPTKGPGLELGLGNAWRSSHDLPYVLVGTTIPIPAGRKFRLVIEAEYLVLRVTADRYRRTWQNFQLVAVDSLGRVHQWSHALALGAGVRIAF